MATSHEYRARLVWQKGAEGIARSDHVVSFAGRPSIEVSAAPEYKGDPSKLNPEELLLASLVSCQMLTYIAMAPRSGIDVIAYADEPVATLAMADKRMRITTVTLRPRITIAPGGDLSQAQALVDVAHRGCFIANSLACEVRIEPEIGTA